MKSKIQWGSVQWLLSALVIHQGDTFVSGHYWSYRNNRSVWYHCDDQNVKKTTLSSIQTVINGTFYSTKRSAYLLFYERINVNDNEREQQKNELEHMENNLNNMVTIRNSKTRQLLSYEQEIYDAVTEYDMIPQTDTVSNRNLWKIPMTGKDLFTLKFNAWVNDEVINYYFALLQQRNIENVQLNQHYPKVLLLNTAWYTQLKTGYDAVKRWTKSIKIQRNGWSGYQHIFQFDKIIMPININNIHWCCGCIDFEDKKLQFFNSKKGIGSSDEFFNTISDFLVKEYNDKNISDINFNINEWINEDQNTIWLYQRDHNVVGDGLYEQYPTNISIALNQLEICGTIQVTKGSDNYVIVKDTNTTANEYTMTSTGSSLTYPQQINDDCGVFTMQCANWICDGMYPDFKETNMRYFRKRILCEIIHESILD